MRGIAHRHNGGLKIYSEPVRVAWACAMESHDYHFDLAGGGWEARRATE